ncbi:class II glutamine amidotransferase, partial [Mesorhizobium sp. M7A.F.Ca.CA.001.08.2.1]
RCIVSEPFDREGGDWQAIPPASFVTISGDDIRIRPFAPAAAKFALVG